MRPAHHQLGARRRRRIGDAPGVGVIHRRYRADHRRGPQTKGIGHARRHGVEDVGAVAVLDALGIAGRATGIAQPRRGVLVDRCPRRCCILAGDQVFVAQQVEARIGRHMRSVGEQHKMCDARKPRRKSLNQLDERQVEKQHSVFGMVGDVDDLIVKQPRVDGVGHPAHPRNAIPAFDVAIGVPRQRRNSVADANVQTPQRRCHLPRAAMHCPPVAAVLTAFARQADDLAVAMVDSGMVDQLPDQQRPILHGAKHLGLPFCCADCYQFV